MSQKICCIFKDRGIKNKKHIYKYIFDEASYIHTELFHADSLTNTYCTHCRIRFTNNFVLEISS